MKHTKSRTFTEITIVLQNNVDVNPSAPAAQYLPLISAIIMQCVPALWKCTEAGFEWCQDGPVLTCPHDQNHHNDDELSRPELSVRTNFLHGHFVCRQYNALLVLCQTLIINNINSMYSCVCVGTFALRGLCFCFFRGFEKQRFTGRTQSADTDGLNVHNVVRIGLQIPQCTALRGCVHFLDEAQHADIFFLLWREKTRI